MFGHKSNISLVFDFMETDLEVASMLNTLCKIYFKVGRMCNGTLLIWSSADRILTGQGQISGLVKIECCLIRHIIIIISALLNKLLG